MNDVQPRPTNINVPLLDLKAQYRLLQAEIEARIRQVCDSQHFIMGPEVRELEEAIAAYSQAKHGIGMSSGTDALLAALMALDIGPGHEVITSTYSFFATGGVISRLGACPVFCDIEPEFYNIDPDAVARYLETFCRQENERVINLETGNIVKAIMPVHLYGQTADMAALTDLGRSYGLKVVEDAAQAIGAETPGNRRAGSIGDIGCFSFFPSKNLGAFGDAGMCVTQSEELAERLRILRLHGANPKYHHTFVGGNFRLDALQAAVLNVKRKFLDKWTAARQKNASRYDKLFAEMTLPIKLPAVQPDCRHIYNQYVIETDDRDALQTFLRGRNIGTEVYYPIPLHLQECFRELGYRQGDCPVAERTAKRTLALPVYPELSLHQQNHVIAQIAQFFDGRSSAHKRSLTA